MTLPPVIWKPVPNFWPGPSGYATRGIVNHRIVGSLQSAYDRFNTVGSNASSTFGIGHNRNGRLVIWQFVALDDDAWANGDVRDPTWPLLIQGVNPNHYTISIEHEDGGSGNRGVVEDNIWEASMGLQVILASGDPERVRAAGITFREDSVVRDLAFIPKDKTGFIDHHQIAGPNKPYCFRPWLDDPGFVNGSPSRRHQLISALLADTEEDPAVIAELEEKLAKTEGFLETCRARAAKYHAALVAAMEDLASLEALEAALAESEADNEALIEQRARLRSRISTIKAKVATKLAELAADVADD
jgi:hypothetical protein